MDFSFTAEQTELRNRLLEFSKAELSESVVQRDQESEFSEELWNRCAAFGIQGMYLPGCYGGSELTGIEGAILGMESLGFGCADGGLLLALNAQMWAVQLPIFHFGTDFQKHRFLPKLCDGSWKGAHGITEPATGSDVFNMQTTATKCEGGYVLNGTKCMVTLAPVADVALVVASTDPSKGKWGISTFLVESEFDGFERGQNEKKMGLRTVPIGELQLKDCFVPDSHRLGKEGGGFSTFSYSLEFERCCILASQVGAMARQLETCVQYARERKQFQKPIGKFQSVSNRIANMKMRLETAKLLLYKVANAKASGKSAMMDAAILKLYLSECYLESSLDAIRVHGGRGYMTDMDVERDARDAMGGVLYAGTSDIQRNIISGLLGL